MKYLAHTVAAVMVAVTLQAYGESADTRWDNGYSDGYGISCGNQGHLIDRDWDDEDYSQGYSAGHASGSTDYRNQK